MFTYLYIYMLGTPGANGSWRVRSARRSRGSAPRQLPPYLWDLMDLSMQARRTATGTRNLLSFSRLSLFPRSLPGCPGTIEFGRPGASGW